MVKPTRAKKKIMAGDIEMDNTLDIELLTLKMTFKNRQTEQKWRSQTP